MEKHLEFVSKRNVNHMKIYSFILNYTIFKQQKSSQKSSLLIKCIQHTIILIWKKLGMTKTIIKIKLNIITKTISSICYGKIVKKQDVPLLVVPLILSGCVVFIQEVTLHSLILNSFPMFYRDCLLLISISNSFNLLSKFLKIT